MNETIWNPVRLAPGDTRTWKLGPMEILVRRARREWRIGHRYELSESSAKRVVSGELIEFLPEITWARWPTSEEGQVVLAPLMPDRPLVVRPDAPITLSPGGSVDFFIGVPAWVSVSEASANGQYLVEVPSRPLSDTWFGELDEGVLCYSSITSARRFLDELDERPNRIVCKLEVRNDNDQPLLIERVCLHIEQLDIFIGDRFLWAPEGRIVYRGINQASQIIFTRTPPNLDNAGRKIGGRPGPQRRGFLARSIASAGEVFQ